MIFTTESQRQSTEKRFNQDKLKSFLSPYLRISVVILVSIFGLAGCRPAPLIVPSYIQNVGVEVFKNQTSYFGLETILTQSTIRAFQLDGRLPIEDPEKSDMVVRCVIRKYIEEPMFYDPKTNVVLQYRLSIVYDLASVDQHEKRTFSEDADRTHSVFYNTPNYAGAITETKDQAIARLGEDMGRSIARRVLEGF